MIVQLFQHIGEILIDSGLGLTQEHLAMGGVAKKQPSIALASGHWNLKVPLLSSLNQEPKRLSKSETFTIPSARAKKKGPYALGRTPETLTGVFILEDPGEANEALSQLKEADFSVNQQEVTLAEEYTGGTQLQVNYTYTGLEHKDRFGQEFSLVVTDQASQTSRLEQTASLILPAIWAHLEDLKTSQYSFAAGNLEAEYSLSELSFQGQTFGSTDAGPEIKLNFSLQGLVSFRRILDGGLHEIEQINLGEQSVALDPKGGFSIQVGNA